MLPSSLASSLKSMIGGGCGSAGTYGFTWEAAKYLDWYRDIAGEGAQWCEE